MAHKVSLKYGDQRKLCATCKGPIRTFALTSCYHAPLCGRCTSRMRYFFDCMNCFVCGHLETHTIYTWQPSLQYEDFDLKTDGRLCHDVDMGVVYQGHSERNKDMRMLAETNEKMLMAPRPMLPKTRIFTRTATLHICARTAPCNKHRRAAGP